MNGNQVGNDSVTGNSYEKVAYTVDKRSKFLLPAVIVSVLLVLITIGLTAATLVIVNSRLKESAITSTPSLNSAYAESVKITDVMTHLNEFQRIATGANGNRAINTLGFNQTLDYITNSLSSHTNFQVQKSFFYLRNFILAGNPILLTSIAGVVKNRTYSTAISSSEFYIAMYSRSANFADHVAISAIPNVGCDESDWNAASPPPTNRVALVKRGTCSFVEKAAFAVKYNVAALLIYNDGTSADRIPPIFISLGEENELPALFLSYTLGQELATAAQDPSNNVGVRLIIRFTDESTFPVGNICADTPTGDATQTIVIGSHSDSVPAGPGINDNGSGSAANLGLAIALARLFQTSSYEKYKYRIRFCWWGAGEVGLLGSVDHVKNAKVATAIGERLQDYLINLNFDMLGSPNYIFGIYDGQTANDATPAQALPGSNKISALFRDWFESQKLPWDFTDFSGRSDYGPFLAEGIVAGGLFSGADETKSHEQRKRYEEALGPNMGGVSGAIQDPCYHKACDSIDNINVFAYEKIVQAAAYAVEYLAKQSDLATWLYPNGRPTRTSGQSSHRKYNSINEYFGLPYL
ncbi:unnamed protein product [Adineta ricciae]|uniref:Peptide hydrolase n=1 Tax=Adineta ricciae TaxID=249248 RepID=A0A814NPL7_ADIRI|nr:unnamed protein product [Adineta ricciae]